MNACGTIAQLQRAQQRSDDMAEPEGPDYDHCESMAEEDASRTPELFLAFLLMHIDASADLPPVNLWQWSVDHYCDASVLDVRGLVALALGCSDAQHRLAALDRLASLVLADSRQWVRDRTALLMLEDA